MDPIAEPCALCILGAAHDDKLTLSWQYSDFDVIHFCSADLVESARAASVIVHLEALSALDEGILVLNASHTLEVVAILRQAHAEKTTALGINLHTLSHGNLLLGLNLWQIEAH